jgi:anti-sigma factor RsiW
MTAWLHPAHIVVRRRRLAAAAGGDLPADAQAATEALAATCPGCQEELEAYRLVSAALATTPPALLTAEEAAGFRAAVQRRIERAAPSPAIPARTGLRALLADHPRMSLATAVAGAAVVLTFTFGPLLGERARPLQESGVDIVSVEAGEGASVMLFEPPGNRPPVIWVFESQPST